jgi:hypothetical protein
MAIVSLNEDVAKPFSNQKKIYVKNNLKRHRTP